MFLVLKFLCVNVDVIFVKRLEDSWGFWVIKGSCYDVLLG